MQNQTLEGFRLSPQQQRLWSLQQNGYIYCSQLAILITGNLSEKLLKSALQKVINRHEIFRTTFYHRPGVKTPIQVIADISTQTWRSINLSKQKEQELKLNKLFQEEKSFIFKLENNPLRLCMINFSDNQHILLITLPSLCADSWTLKNLLHEIYQAYVSEETQLLEPTQYIQFSEWQNELLEEDAEAGKNYWQNQNLKTQQALILPFESKINQTIPFSQKVFYVDLSDYLEKIDTAITKSNTKLSDFLFTCFHILISRLTTQSNVIINTLFSGRKYEEVYETMGLLAQSLPIISLIDKDFKFSEVLSQISQQIRQADKYQEYFALSSGADSSISFDFEELPEEYHASEVSFSLYKHYVCLDCCKLKLSCLHKQESLVAQFHYNDNIYTDENIQRLAEQFQTLVDSAATNLETAVGKLEILTYKERHQLLVEFNNTQTNYPQDKCIHQLFEQQVEQTPNNIAVVFENQHLTYAELNAKANQLACYLKRLGVGKEVLVGLCVERSVDIIVGILGILKAGAAYLPLEPTLPKASLAFRLQDVQASILLTQQSLVEKLPANVAQIICLDTNREIAQEPLDNLKTTVQPENLVYALFTSGSTGNPKAVAVEHRQLVNYLYAIVERLNLDPGASFATISSFAADLGNTVIFPALCTGGRLHIISQERGADPEALADYFRHHPIDCLKIVPSHLATLMASSPTSSILPQQCLILGGEASSWDLISIIHQQAPNCKIHNHYGPTETTVGVLTYPVDPVLSPSNISHSDSKTVPLGKPLANTQVYVLDNQLQPVPFGVMGELYIGGASLARGYLNRPELTFERFILNPFTSVLGEKLYKTGDLARYLTDGNIEFVGRIDNQVKIRGFRIELEEIEATFKQHEAVQEVVVLATQEVHGDRRLVAYIVTSSEFRRQNLQSTLLKELRNFGKQHLPEYMIPSAFVLLKTLPRTPNGKVDRQALPARLQTHPDIEEQYVAPRTSVEKQLAFIWANLLGLEKVGIHDNFFELGGHSLLITQLLAQVRKAFQINLSISSLFEVPTVAGLAARIEKQTPETDIVTDIATLMADSVLDPAICSNNFTFDPYIVENAIFLTGATGFLGVFLLNELLQRTRADIYCLVRSNNIESGKQKIQNTLESYLLWDEKFSQRIIPVVGDLSQPLLGLSQEEFQILASIVDTIYHNGALVNFTYPYSALKAANVLGTQEILRLASQIKLKPVHFISTLGVIVDGEQDSKVPSTGYTQSKWVAEKLVTIARSRGLPISIYRPGRISGSSKTGVCNTNDHTFRTIKGCIQLGKVPDRNTTVNISPVDYVSQAIVYLSRQKESLGKIFHLVNPQPAHWRQVVNYIRSYGYPIIEIPESEWRAELLNSKNFEENALYPLISMFTEDANNITTVTSESKFDCQNTLAGLATTSINCPPVNQELFNTYFSYLIHSGFLQSTNNIT